MSILATIAGRTWNNIVVLCLITCSSTSGFVLDAVNVQQVLLLWEQKAKEAELFWQSCLPAAG